MRYQELVLLIETGSRASGLKRNTDDIPAMFSESWVFGVDLDVISHNIPEWLFGTWRKTVGGDEHSECAFDRCQLDGDGLRGVLRYKLAEGEVNHLIRVDYCQQLLMWWEFLGLGEQRGCNRGRLSQTREQSCVH